MIHGFRLLKAVFVRLDDHAMALELVGLALGTASSVLSKWAYHTCKALKSIHVSFLFALGPAFRRLSALQSVLCSDAQFRF